jgi:methyl-accepting chemotaxis protein
MIPTLALIIFGMGISSYVSYYFSKDSLDHTLTNQLKSMVNSVENILDSWLRDRKLDVETWSAQKLFNSALNDSFVGKAARKSANRNLQSLREKYPYYEDIALADGAGEIISSSTEAVIGKINIKDRGYFKEAISGKLSVSKVILSRGSGNPIFVIASPVKDKEEVKGVLFGLVDINTFSKLFVQSQKVGKTGYAYILQEDGWVIAHRDNDKIFKVNVNDFDFGKQIMAQGQGMIKYTYEGVEKVVAFETSTEMGWIIAAGVPTDELLAPARKVGLINFYLALGTVLLAVVVVYFITRSIANPINKISNGLSRGADQVASASGQIASASESLAEGSSEQAASIEETSASLEEMASMTKQNADNASQADALMKETNTVVSSARTSMGRLTNSMDEISKASEETSKIIKTIDEIAFQTNLLALNAAVEAARAGEAGAGFAVVADEVRNLAMRAAEAAKDTSGLIESTLGKVGQGSEFVSETSKAFEQVGEQSEKAGGLVTEIAMASSEQSDGIDQLNRAVSEMDRVIQQNAASAEESSSVTQEMRNQAETMQSQVQQLIALVRGGKNQVQLKNTAQPSHGMQYNKKNILAKSPQTKTLPQKSEMSQSRQVDPETVIPFDEDDLKDF